MTFEVREGDCVELMRAMPACSVDSVVCDPPAGIGSDRALRRDDVHHWVESALIRICRLAKSGELAHTRANSATMGGQARSNPYGKGVRAAIV